MNHRIGIIAIIAAIAAMFTAQPATAASEPRSHDCVNAPEWNRLDDLGPTDDGARSSVIEKAWNVRPIGHVNEYWMPANPKLWYSKTYRACGDDRYMKVIVVYRITSDTWQYSLKGEFLPNESGTGVGVPARIVAQRHASL
jgi:hypothetical protein